MAPGVDFQAVILLQKSPGVGDDFHVLRTSEEREPANDRCGHEVGRFRFEEPIPTACPVGPDAAKRSFGKGHSQAERGNEGNTGQKCMSTAGRVPCPSARRGHVFGITAECGRRRASSHNPRVLPRDGRAPESVSTVQRSGACPCVDVLLLLSATVSVERSQPNVARGSDRPGQANPWV
jgi:hypothetical protein